MVRHSSARWLLVAGFASGLLTGCSSDGGGDDGPQSLDQLAAEARANGYDWQAGLLEDGDVTLAEYDEGHRRNLECLTAAGMTYTDPVRIVLDGYTWDYLISWEGMDDETGDRMASACGDENLTYLELAMSSWGDWQTEPAVLTDLVQCVTAAGFEVETGVQNYREVWLSAADQGLTYEQVSGCIAQAMQRLHPGAGYGIGF